MATRFGMLDDISLLVQQQHTCLLGHVACRNDDRAPKQVLFGKLPVARPRHGLKKKSDAGTSSLPTCSSSPSPVTCMDWLRTSGPLCLETASTRATVPLLRQPKHMHDADACFGSRIKFTCVADLKAYGL